MPVAFYNVFIIFVTSIVFHRIFCVIGVFARYPYIIQGGAQTQSNPYTHSTGMKQPGELHETVDMSGNFIFESRAERTDAELLLKLLKRFGRI